VPLVARLVDEVAGLGVPDLEALVPACSAHWLAEHPRPDLAGALALADPAERLRAALTLHYGWYRANAPMQRRVLGERATVPELDAWMARSTDMALAEFATVLSAGFGGAEAHAVVALAVDFWTCSASAARAWMTRRRRRS
jgi:hypothetical protein